MKGLAPGLALKQRPKVIQKWPWVIGMTDLCCRQTMKTFQSYFALCHFTIKARNGEKCLTVKTGQPAWKELNSVCASQQHLEIWRWI